jgi:uncharacterized membrane protein
MLLLAAVVVLALFGIILSFWVYLLLFITCPLVAGISWYIYKDMDKKVSNTRKGKLGV